MLAGELIGFPFEDSNSSRVHIIDVKSSMGKKSIWPPVIWTGTVRMQKHKQNGTHGGVYGLKKRVSHDLDATSKHGKKKTAPKAKLQL